MDVEMLYFHTHKQMILKFDNLAISQFEVSYEVLFISFSTTLFQYFSIILEKNKYYPNYKIGDSKLHLLFKMLDHSVLERIWVKGSYPSQWLPQGERGPPKESKSL